MVKRSNNRLPWSIRLASVLLLHVLVVSAPLAADAPALALIGDDEAGIAPGTDLYLEVVLNDAPTGQLAHFRLRDGSLHASAGTLRELGFALGTDDRSASIDVAALPGVSVDYDAARQRVSLRAPLRLLDLATAVLNTPQPSAARAEASPGVLVNYDVYAAGGDAGPAVSGFGELRAFGVGGVFRSSAISRAVRLPGSGWHGDTVRLDSDWRFSFPASATTLTFGDLLTGSLDYSRPTRIGGVQFARDFTLQPYRLTMPLPAFAGEAVAPSAIDLYVNGIRQYSGSVPPGPFSITAIPTMSGVGQAQVVVTDAFGRSSTIDFSFYSANELLQAGLSDWSFELGVVRENYGITSFDYADDPMASASLRRGVSDRLTVSGHAEALDGFANAGAGANLLAGTSGVVEASLARSSGFGASGSQASLGYDWRGSRLSFSAHSTHTSGDFRDVASLYGRPPPRVNERALLGLNLARRGSIGVGYLNLRYPGEERARYANAYYFKSFGDTISMSLNVNQNLDDATDRSVFLGVSLPLGAYSQASASVQRDNGRTQAVMDAMRPVPGEGGFGWHVQARDGQGGTDGLAEAGFNGTHAEVRGGVNASAGEATAYADLSGALVFMGGHAFAARHIDDAFAVVSTSGVADVPVQLENREIGRTDADGMLLVARLNAYQANKLAIDPMQLPADLRIERVSAEVTPADRSGTLVDFDIVAVRAATVILVDASGAPLAPGTPVRLRGQAGAGAIVGFDGVVYLDTLDARNTLDAQPADGTCSVRFDYPETGEPVPEIGPLTCVAEGSP
jgi:outer membrane usher protein